MVEFTPGEATLVLVGIAWGTLTLQVQQLNATVNKKLCRKVERIDKTLATLQQAHEDRTGTKLCPSEITPID